MNQVPSGFSPLSSEDYKKRQAILDKPWKDCSVEDKLEKVREELIQLGHMSWSINNLQTEIAKLKEHDHKDGKLVLPLNAVALNTLGTLGGLASRRNNLA